MNKRTIETDDFIYSFNKNIARMRLFFSVSNHTDMRKPKLNHASVSHIVLYKKVKAKVVVVNGRQ
jgi:hypothetical protein